MENEMEHFKEFKSLSAHDMDKMFKTAAQYLLAYEVELNELNVFPVADHDTGSNVAQLMKRIIAASYQTSSVDVFLKALADDALLGACGNSGMIFAAFFAGLSDGNEEDYPEISIARFVSRVNQGVQKAYHSVNQPVEGTILTAMSAWLNACESLLLEVKNFGYLFEKSLSILDKAVINTKQQHRVIDSGALAFYRFVQGMYAYLANPLQTDFTQPATLNETIAHSHIETHQPNYDYCTEMLLSKPAIDFTTLQKNLETWGDSVVMNQSPNYIKIHLHTNDPLGVTNFIKRHATIESQKVECMQAQWQVIQQTKYPIALVVDSSADIEMSFLQNEQIHVLPINIRVGQQNLLDRITINLTTLYDELHKQKLTAQSASVTPEVVQRTLRFLNTYYQSIIVISVSSNLSSTHQLLSQSISKFPEAKITLIDSKKNSAAHGLLAMYAARQIKAGLNHEAICELVNKAIPNTELWVAVNEFKTMTRSGRAPKLVGILAGWSQIKPIVSLDRDGKPSLSGIAFGQKHAWYKITKKIQYLKKEKKINELAIVHTDCLELANRFADYIKQKTGIQASFITTTSAAIGLHAGQGCVGVAIISEDLA